MTKRSSGQSLIEVLVVMVVGSIIILAIVSLVLNSMKSSQFAQSQIQATKYAQEAIDKIKDIRARDGSVAYSCGDTCSAAKFSDLWSNLPLSCSTSCYFVFGTDAGFTKLVGNQSIGDHPDIDSSLTRYITLTRSADRNEITVSVKVRWTDSLGDHESNLQTTLNK